MRWLIMFPLLVGCAASEVDKVQTSLDRYASLSAAAAPLESVLSGPALASAQRNYQLLHSLELAQQGLASFEVSSAAGGFVSDVEFFNQRGELLELDRQDRARFTATYDSEYLISSLEVSQEAC
jgi:hypothetical protein